MLTLRPDPPIEGAPEDAVPPAWTVLSNDAPVGRAWASRYSEQVTLHIQGVSVVDTSISDALARAQRHFADDPRKHIEALIESTTSRIAQAEAAQEFERSGALRGLLLALEDAARAASVVAEQYEPVSS